MCDTRVSGQISRATHEIYVSKSLNIHLHVCHSRVAEQIYWATCKLHTRSEQICWAACELHAST